MLSHALRGEQTQSQLAEQCALDKTTMVVTMDELERAGLAERRPSPTDRRARIIAVTEAGERSMVARPTRSSSGIYADVLASLPAGSATPFVAALATAGRPAGSRRRPSASARCAVARARAVVDP